MVIMKVIWRFLAIPSIFTLTLMQVMKAFFLLNNRNYLKHVSWTEIMGSFTHSFSLDLATWSYIFIIPVLWLIISNLLKFKDFNHRLYIAYYTWISVLIVALNWIDVQMFSHWNAKLSAKALFYLNTPQMMLASAGYSTAVFFIVISSLLFFLFGWIYKRIIPVFPHHQSQWHTAFIYLGLIAALILGLRGGFREIPINQSDAYFSDNQILNVAGVNSLWNLGNILFQNQNSLKENPYRLLPEETAMEVFKQITQTPHDTSIQVIKNKRPNIVFLALEGVNANCISKYNASLDYMPEVSKIMDEAYAFEHMYASGMRTDQGLVALLSGFPALPLHTIGAQPEKFQHLPSFPLDLQAKGYTNTFFFAGEPEFGSFKAFLIHNGFEKVYSLDDFTPKQRTQDLGAPDEYLFERFIQDTKQFEEPFFSLILTQSTHEPFDMPFNDKVDDDAARYINTVKYVDSLIGHWYTSCKEMPWFDNTLFIISSDHSHTFPSRYWYTDPERYRIPFILFGPAIDSAYYGKMNTQMVNQTDIAMSLAKQMNLPYENYTFSKDIFNPNSPEYSTYIHIHGHNYLSPNEFSSVNFDLDKQSLVEKIQEDSGVLKNAAYFQVAFQTYMNY